MSILMHPHRYDPTQFDAETRRLLTATVNWFEQRGLRKLLEDFHAQNLLHRVPGVPGQGKGARHVPHTGAER